MKRSAGVYIAQVLRKAAGGGCCHHAPRTFQDRLPPPERCLPAGLMSPSRPRPPRQGRKGGQVAGRKLGSSPGRPNDGWRALLGPDAGGQRSRHTRRRVGLPVSNLPPPQAPDASSVAPLGLKRSDKSQLETQGQSLPKQSRDCSALSVLAAWTSRQSLGQLEQPWVCDRTASWLAGRAGLREGGGALTRRSASQQPVPAWANHSPYSPFCSALCVPHPPSRL